MKMDEMAKFTWSEEQTNHEKRREKFRTLPTSTLRQAQHLRLPGAAKTTTTAEHLQNDEENGNKRAGTNRPPGARQGWLCKPQNDPRTRGARGGGRERNVPGGERRGGALVDGGRACGREAGGMSIAIADRSRMAVIAPPLPVAPARCRLQFSLRLASNVCPLSPSPSPSLLLCSVAWILAFAMAVCRSLRLSFRAAPHGRGSLLSLFCRGGGGLFSLRKF